jgi:hypothetical protein
VSLLLADTPIIECLVRREMFYDQAKPVGARFQPGYIFGFCGRATHAPAFQVMTDEGAQWARVPLHMLCWKECPAMTLDLLCWWDCFSDEFTVHAFDFLRGQPCTAIDRVGHQARRQLRVHRRLAWPVGRDPGPAQAAPLHPADQRPLRHVPEQQGALVRRELDSRHERPTSPTGS